MGMTIDEMIAVLQAYKEGKTIECHPISDITGWYKLLNNGAKPEWNFGKYEYRIKTEPHYRPFESAEEVLEAIKEHGSYVKEGNTYRLLKKFTAHEDGTITYTFSGWSSTTVRDWDAIHDKIVWADGTPFGKLEE